MPTKKIIAESLFETDLDGWQVRVGYPNMTGTMPLIGPYTGLFRTDPDTYVNVETMNENLNRAWFSAPAKFLGDIRAAYEHEFAFHVMLELGAGLISKRMYSDHQDLIIIGATDTLLFKTSVEALYFGTIQNPPIQNISVTLSESTNCLLTSTQQPPTREEFLAVLGDVTGLLIRADYASDISDWKTNFGIVQLWGGAQEESVLAALKRRFEESHAAAPADELSISPETITPLGASTLGLLQEFLQTQTVVLKGNDIKIEASLQGTSSDYVAVSGTCKTSFLQIEQPQIKATFVEVESKIASRIVFETKSGWTFATTFPDLETSDLKHLSFLETAPNNPKLILTDITEAVPESGGSLSRGLNFYGKLTVTGTPNPFADVLPVNAELGLLGAVTVQDAKQQIVLKANTSVDLALALPRLDPLSLKAAQLTIETKFSSELNAYIDSFVFSGQLVLAGKETPCILQKLSDEQYWQLKLDAQNKTVSTSEMLPVLKADSVFAYFPTAVFDLLKLNVDLYQLSYQPGDDGYFGTALTLLFLDPWNSVPVLKNITDIKIQLEISQYKYFDQEIQSAFSAIFAGTVAWPSRPDLKVDLLFHIAGLQAWRVEVKPQFELPLPSVNDIAALINNVDLGTKLPTGMNAGGMLKLNKLEFGLNTQASYVLNYVSIDLEVTKDWPVITNYLTLMQTSLELKIDNPLSANDWAISGKFEGKVKFGDADGIPFLAQKLTAHSGWTIQIAKDTQVPIPGVTDLMRLANAETSTSYLPTAVSSLKGFVLSDIFFEFGAQDNALQTFSFFIGQENAKDKWHIIANKLVVSEIKINLTLQKPFTLDKLFGFISGTVQIGSTVVPVMAEKITADAGWNLKLASDYTVELPKLSDLFSAFDENKSFTGLPQKIKDFPTFYFSDIDILFKPNSKELQKYSFKVGTTSEWILLDKTSPLGELKIGKVDVALTVDKKPAEPVVTGIITGSVTVISIPVALRASRTKASDPWKLKGNITERVNLTKHLKELSSWMLPTDVDTLIPDSFMPSETGFELTELAFDINLTDSKLDKILFTVRNSQPWKVFDPYIIVDASVTGIIEKPGHEQQSLTCKIVGIFTVGLAKIKLEAERKKDNTSQQYWQFSGSLVDSVPLNFGELWGKADPGNTMPIPSTLNFPPLELTKINATLIPAYGTVTESKFTFSADSQLTSDLQFGNATFKLKNLGGRLNVTKPKDSTAKIVGQIVADFTFATINTKLALQLGHADTVFVARLAITPEELANVKIGKITDGIVINPDGSNQQEKWANTTVDLDSPVFAEAYIFLNYTRNLFFVYGALKDFGSAIFLTKKQADNSWAYLAGITLGDGFTFAKLYPALAVIDKYLTIRNAGLFISSFEVQSSELIKDINVLDNFEDKPDGFSLPVSIKDLPSRQLKKGVYFYAHLEFTPFTLFGNLLQIGGQGNFDNIIISAFIGQGDNTGAPNMPASPANTVFTADLPDITFLNTIILTKSKSKGYEKLHLEYHAGDSRKLTLFGGIQLSLFEKMYEFDGSLIVTSADLKATLDLISDGNSEPFHPFKLPGIALTKLQLELLHTFRKPANANLPEVPSSTTLAVSGSMVFSAGLEFTAFLHLANGKPALAEIKLDKELPVLQFLKKCITGGTTQGPSTFVGISFLENSRIYYYDKDNDQAGIFANDSAGNPNLKGFHVDAHMKITLIKEIFLHVTVDVEPQDPNQKYPAQYNSLTITAGLENWIDFKFMQIASNKPPRVASIQNGQPSDSYKLYRGGPGIEIKTGNPGSFGFVAGLNFFSTPFGTTRVTVRPKPGVGTELAGNLTAADSFGFLGKPSFDFSYSKKNGFKIDNWPLFQLIDRAKKVINFIEEIKKLANTSDGSPCGQLSVMVTSVAFQNEFHIKPSLSGDDSGLALNLNGQFNFKFLEISAPLITLDFPKTVVVHLPTSLKFADLPGEIVTALGEAAGSFVHSLLSNRKELVTLMAILFGGKAGQVALEMLCNELIDSVTAAAAAEAGEAVGAVAAGALTVGIITGAVATAITHAVASGNGGNTGDPSNPGKPAPPIFKSLQFNTPNVVAKWQAMVYAGGYDFQIVKPSGGVIGNKMQNLSVSTLQAQAPALDTALPAGTYTGQVRSRRGSFKSAWNSKQIAKLETAASVNLTYSPNSKRVLLSWVGTAPNGFHVELLRGNDIVNAAELTTTTNSYDAQTLQPGVYTARVMAKGSENQIPGNFGLSTASLTKPAAPTDIRLTNFENKIEVTWNDPNEPITGYIVELWSGGQKIRQKTVTIPMAVFDPSNLPPSDYTAKVRIRGDSTHIASDLANSQNHITKPGSPSKVLFSYNPDTLEMEIAWDQVIGNNGYEIQIFEVGNWESSVWHDTVEKNKTTYSLHHYAIANVMLETLQAKVRVKNVDHLDGNFTSSTGTISPQPPPQNVDIWFEIENAQIGISWDNVPADTPCDIQIVDYQFPESAIFTLEAAVGIQKLYIKFVDFPVGAGRYLQANVRAKGSAHKFESDFWSSSNSLNQLSVRAPVELKYERYYSQLVVTWPVVPNSSGFEIELFEVKAPDTVIKKFQYAAQDPNAMPDETNKLTIPTYELNMLTEGDYKVRIQAKGSRQFLSSLFLDSMQSVPKLQSPQNVKLTLLPDGESVKVTWNTVQGNTAYSINIVSAEHTQYTVGGLRTDEDETSAEFGYGALDGWSGDYKVQVQAFANENSLDSGFTLSNEKFNKLMSPRGLTLVYDQPNDRLILTWKNLTGNGGYVVGFIPSQVGFVGSPKPLDNAPTFEAAKDQTTLYIPIIKLATMFGAHGAIVRAKGNPKSLGSDYSPLQGTFNKLMGPEVISLFWDENGKNFVVNWSNVPGCDRYRVELVDAKQNNRIIAQADISKDEISREVSSKQFNYGELVNPPSPMQAIVRAKGTESIIDGMGISAPVEFDFNSPFFANELIAHYPLNRDGKDITGKSPDIKLTSTPFQNGGIYCNGEFNVCQAITELFPEFNFSLFYFSADFKVDEYLDTPLLVGGTFWLWAGAILNKDGTFSFLANRSIRERSTIKYTPGAWHHLLVAYDINRREGRLFLDNQLALTVEYELETGGDATIGITNMGNSTVFKGTLKNLKIATLQSVSAKTTRELVQPNVLASPIAHYPLRTDVNDVVAGGKVNVQNAPFQDGGVYCNGITVYSDDGTPTLTASTIRTPILQTLDFKSFYISADFKVDEHNDEQPVFIGGHSYQWIGVILNKDGSLSLLYDHLYKVKSSLKYSLNQWHNIVVTYNGQEGKLYLDNRLACSSKFHLFTQQQESNTDKVVTLSGSGDKALKGYFSELKVGTSFSPTSYYLRVNHPERGYVGNYSPTGQIINGQPVYIHENFTADRNSIYRWCYIFLFNQKDRTWVLQPLPPKPGEWLANAFATGDNPWGLNWRSGITVERMEISNT